MDSLTFWGLIFSTFAIGLAFYSIWYSSRMKKQRLSKIESATNALQGDKDAKTLCDTIRSIAAYACPEGSTGKTGLDKTELRQILENLKQELKAEL